MNNKELNNAILKLRKRAEANDPSVLISTFVDTGNLLSMLLSHDHQVIHGRRGTGKTHVLVALQSALEKKGELAVYVDLRNLGSNGGVHADEKIPLSQRGTRLLVDVLEAMHENLLERAFRLDTDVRFASPDIFPALDGVADAATQVRIVGDLEVASAHEASASVQQEDSAGFTISSKPALQGKSSSKEAASTLHRSSTVQRGYAEHRVHFGALSRAVGRLIKAIPNKHLWILLDEWSAVPLDLQPYLADLLRRSLLSVQGVIVKIAAIEARSTFQLPTEHGDYIGIELGADMSADVDLDDFMVFGSDPKRAESFFAELFYRHLKSLLEPQFANALHSSNSMVSQVFTQRNAFTELVRAGEGVPRDAINILNQAAQAAGEDPISVPHIRAGARKWHLRDKEKAIEQRPDAKALLHWIVDEVIREKKARAFLLEQGPSARHPLIRDLHDARLLHIVKRGIAARDRPGVRYDAYGIDYGCYVDLINTSNQPLGLLQDEDSVDVDRAGYVDVPPDDLRSIRRAVLDLDRFDRERAARKPIIRKAPATTRRDV